ncbi:MAG: sulfotransferase [Rhodothermales bacterium]
MNTAESVSTNSKADFIPGISIVAFSYNFGRYISECLESLVSQTLRPLEIIVCDDCSTDDSWSHIQRFKNQYPDLFRIFRHDVNIGHVKNGIFGKEQVQGNLFTVIDCDDRWHPDKLKLEWQALANNPRARTAYSGVTLINEQGEKIGSWMDPRGIAPPSGDVFIQAFAKRFFPNTPSLFRNQLIYTNVLKEINYKEFNQELIHADWNLKLNLASRYEVVYSGKPLVDYRQHGTSIHRTQSNKLYESAKYVISKNLPLLRSRSVNEIEFVLSGINALMVRLATREGKPVISYTKENLNPSSIIVNSVPGESDTRLLESLLSMMPGLQRAELSLSCSTEIAVCEKEDIAAREKVDMPKRVPLNSSKAQISKLESGEFVSGHLPYSAELDAYLQENNLKMVLLLSDPRTFVVSFTRYVVANKDHPLHQHFIGLSQEEQKFASIRGVNSEELDLLSVYERFSSVEKWIGNSGVLIVKVEDLVANKTEEERSRQFYKIKEIAQFLSIKLGDIYVKEIIDTFLRENQTTTKIASWEGELNDEQLDEIYQGLGKSSAKLGYDIRPSMLRIPRNHPASNDKTYRGENLMFLISQPRSGSTLLQRILGGHKEIHTVAEPWLMLHPLYALRKKGIQTDYSAQLAHDGLEDFISSLPQGKSDYFDGIRAMSSVLYGRALLSSGKRIFLDKTPRYYNIIPELTEVFPDAKIVLLLRNPLSVLSSVLKTWVGRDWVRLQLHRDDILRAPSLIAEALEVLGDQITVFRYEQFVQAPALQMQQLCQSLDISYEADMLNYGLAPAPKGRMGDSQGINEHVRPEKASLDKWKTTFSYPTYRLLAEIVLTLTGRDVITKMGFSFDDLYDALMQIPLDPFRIPKEEIVAMVSALRLTPENVSRITPLIQPYLVEKKSMVAT